MRDYSWHGRWKTIGTTAGVIATTCTLLAATQSATAAVKSSPLPKEVRVGFQVIPNTEAIAKAVGFHEKDLKGVKIKWLQFASGKDVNTAMAARSVDIAVIGSSPVTIGLASGLPYQVIWIADVEGDNEALVVKKNAHIESVKDLVGKNVATPFGSTSHFSLVNALVEAKVNQNKVHLLDMSPDSELAAWQRGDIQAAYVWEPVLSKLKADGGKVILTSRQMAKRGVVTADLIVASASFANKYPNVVADYLKGEIQAYNLYKEHPLRAAKDVAKEFDISVAEAQKEMRELVWLSPAEQLSKSYLGTAKHKGNMANIMDRTAKFLAAQNMIQSVPAKSLFDKALGPQYLEQANH